MVLLVHSSLSRLGWVCGGAVAVVKALEAILDEDGTLVMPAHSGDLSEPSNWTNPLFQRAGSTQLEGQCLLQQGRNPHQRNGCNPETFRKMKGVIRSDHPPGFFRCERQESLLHSR